MQIGTITIVNKANIRIDMETTRAAVEVEEVAVEVGTSSIDRTLTSSKTMGRTYPAITRISVSRTPASTSTTSSRTSRVDVVAIEEAKEVNKAVAATKGTIQIEAGANNSKVADMVVVAVDTKTGGKLSTHTSAQELLMCKYFFIYCIFVKISQDFLDVYKKKF